MPGGGMVVVSDIVKEAISASSLEVSAMTAGCISDVGVP